MNRGMKLAVDRTRLAGWGRLISPLIVGILTVLVGVVTAMPRTSEPAVCAAERSRRRPCRCGLEQPGAWSRRVAARRARRSLPRTS
jgi:hypothetical protein